MKMRKIGQWLMSANKVAKGAKNPQGGGLQVPIGISSSLHMGMEERF